MDKRTMRTIIRRNGHLIQTGEESIDELREALYFLRQHTHTKCQKLQLGTPIEILLPDITVLATARMRSMSASAGIGKERR